MGRTTSRIRSATGLTGPLAALALAAGIAILATPGPARAEDSDSSKFYDLTFGRLMEGFGFQRSDRKDEINYTERPPLVLPGSRDLPPPEKSSAINNPAWPKDPDVKRRKLMEQMEKNRIVSDEREREQNPLRQSELTPGPAPKGGMRINTGPGRNGATDYGEVLSPSALGFNGGLLGKMFRGKDEDTAQFTGEPPRTELTAPPPGYQTPSPNQPYGVGQAKTKAEDDYMHRGELKSGSER
ncbi:MAG TPA: hypothetical protein VFB31_09735 [Pseudolabrys sp.]|nr:hypothetical protein [Pseudolabrys sp.]